MKVNFIHWQYSTFPKGFPKTSTGGAELAIWEIAKRVSKKHKVRIFCLSDKNSITKTQGIEFVRIQAPLLLRSKWVRSDYYFFKVMRQINKESESEKQIVHCISCIEPVAYTNNKVSIVLNMHNEIKKYLPYPSFKREWYEKRINRLDYATGVSNYITKSFLNYFLYDKNYAKTIYNGADFKIFNPRNSNKRKVCKKYGLDSKKPLLYFGGRIIRRKGLHLLLDAIEGLDVNLVITGIVGKTSSDKDYYEEILKKVKNKENIKFLGDLKKKDRGIIISSADLSFCPSIWDDPSPLMCYESQTAGTPIIGFKWGGIPELIETGKTGIVCNQKELKKYIVNLTKNKKKLKEMSKNAYNKSRKEFDWDKVAKEYLRIYERLKNDTIN